MYIDNYQIYQPGLGIDELNEEFNRPLHNYKTKCKVKCDREWFDEVKLYEKEVLSNR